MEKHVLITKINEVLTDEFEVDMHVISPDANIKKALQLDSLSLIDMVALIEETFRISFKGAEIATIQTFEALYDFVHIKTSE